MWNKKNYWNAHIFQEGYEEDIDFNIESQESKNYVKKDYYSYDEEVKDRKSQYDSFQKELVKKREYNAFKNSDNVKIQEDVVIKVKDITKGVNGDRAKLKAIYNWVLNNIEFDNQGYYKHPESGGLDAVNQESFKVLNNKKAISLGYSNLITDMGRSVGLNIHTVRGVPIKGRFRVGHNTYTDYLEENNMDPLYAWNICEIGGSWYKFDVVEDKVNGKNVFNNKKLFENRALYLSPVDFEFVEENFINFNQKTGEEIIKVAKKQRIINRGITYKDIVGFLTKEGMYAIVVDEKSDDSQRRYILLKNEDKQWKSVRVQPHNKKALPTESIRVVINMILTTRENIK